MDYAQKKHEGHTMSMTHFFYNNMWTKGGRKKTQLNNIGDKKLRNISQYCIRTCTQTWSDNTEKLF